MSERSRKEQVIDLLKGLETAQAPDLGYIHPDKYIQHNLAAKDGLQGLKEFLETGPTQYSQSQDGSGVSGWQLCLHA